MYKILKASLIKFTVLIVFIFSATNLMAANETIEMLNKLGKESMVYSKKIVRISSGDTVFWKSTDKGHNVEFIKGGVPEGAEKFKSKFNKDTEYKFTVPGIYAYWCTPHKSMGMIGFVIVGDDKSNLEAVKSIRFSGKSKKIATELINSL
tara:strand:+ start:6257 stop:6706 length:450 start_codon:yes stop_codon:yes gene_type:complete